MKKKNSSLILFLFISLIIVILVTIILNKNWNENKLHIEIIENGLDSNESIPELFLTVDLSFENELGDSLKLFVRNNMNQLIDCTAKLICYKEEIGGGTEYILLEEKNIGRLKFNQTIKDKFTDFKMPSGVCNLEAQMDCKKTNKLE